MSNEIHSIQNYKTIQIQDKVRKRLKMLLTFTKYTCTQTEDLSLLGTSV